MQENPKRFGVLIDRNNRVIKQEYLNRFKKAGIPITTEQWVLIDILYRHKGISYSELAHYSFKNSANITRIVNLLIKKKLATRIQSLSDKRSYLVQLTDKGYKVYSQLSPIVKDLRKEGWKSLTEEDFDNFKRIMGIIYKNYYQE